MATICRDCHRTFGTRRAYKQHLRDSPVHAVTFDCNECDRTFGTEQALQQHLRDSPVHAVTFNCNECNRAFDTEQALQQHLRDQVAYAAIPGADLSRSFELQPSLHDQVLQSLSAYDLAFDFFTADDEHDVLKEHDTSIMGTFTCTNRSCSATRWTSKQIAITIRQYPGGRYNARVYFQRCKLCNSLGRPELGHSYAERISYRLAKWSGIAVEEPPYSGHSRRPHQYSLCEGCKYGRCPQSRL